MYNYFDVFLIFFALKGKEMKSVLYAAIVACSLYMYLMHYVTEDLTRVAQLGFLCVIFTITMQASPLAVVVCEFHLHCACALPYIAFYQERSQVFSLGVGGGGPI